jgi:hypothetical protein
MSSSMARTEKGQEHDRLAPYSRRWASVGSRLRPWVGAAGWGGRTGRRTGRRMRRPTTVKTMVRAWCETLRGRAIATTRVGVGAVVGRIWGVGTCSYTLCREWVARRWRHEGREKRSRMVNEMVATEARTIIIVRRYRWLNGLFLASLPEERPI